MTDHHDQDGSLSVPDSLEGERESVVLNPEAIGELGQTPRVWVGADLRALFKPCVCGGVNGYHTDECAVS